MAAPDDPLPTLDYGPLINDTKVKELTEEVDATIARGGVPLYRGSMDRGWFLPGQDTSAYLPPVAILTPPSPSPLHHAEPFGPVDTIVLVYTEAELLAAPTTLSPTKRAELRGVISTKPGLNRYLRVTASG